MKRAELLSRLLIALAIVGAVAAPLYFWMRTPLIHARMSESGGWTPDVIKAETGKPLHLRFTSDDVIHGFAVGQNAMQPVTIEPGKVTDLTLTFDEPGVYTFYCTRWCGLNHWRMRGTIEVGGSTTKPTTPVQPLYVTLGIDLDAPHESPVVPAMKPSAVHGQQLLDEPGLSTFDSANIYRSTSPHQLYETLSSTNLSDSEKWDVVSFVWWLNTTPVALARGKELYTQNCAACHGENGGGDGVFSDELAKAGEASAQKMEGAHAMIMQKPASFADPKRMLGASPALLQGKILRGGMGTGMPMWGAIFTDDQIWDLVAYLYSFQFDYSGLAR